MTDQRPRVIYCTATQRIIDFVHDGLGETDETAIARLKGEYGTALTPMPANAAQRLYEDQFKTPVQEISAEDFDDGLNVLPPVCWTRARGAQSFKISERVAGCVTAIYVNIGDRYFRFQDDIRMPHDTACERVLAFIATRKAKAAEARQ